MKRVHKSRLESPTSGFNLFFDNKQRFRFFAIPQTNYLINPYAGEHERAVFVQSLGLTGFQVKALDDSLKQQFDRLFAVIVKIVFERAPPFRQLFRRQQPAAESSVKRCQIRSAKAFIAEQDVGFDDLSGAETRFGDRRFADVVRPPPGGERNRIRKHQTLHHQAIALHPSAIAAARPLAFLIDISEPQGNQVGATIFFVPARTAGLIHSAVDGAHALRLRDAERG